MVCGRSRAAAAAAAAAAGGGGLGEVDALLVPDLGLDVVDGVGGRELEKWS
jgi:hypothetical protein